MTTAVCVHEHVEQIGTNSKGEPVVECLACGTTPDGEVCSDCFDLLDDGEGWDGRCGSCADRADSDHQTCDKCGDTVYALSSRGWCDSCEEAAAFDAVMEGSE